MNIIRMDKELIDEIAPLVADFRVALRAYKGIESEPDIADAKSELVDFIESGHPVFVAKDVGNYVGYIVCRIEDKLVWVEQLYVCESSRRKGIASALFEKAEELSRSFG